MVASIAHRWRQSKLQLLDWLFPPQCLACRQPMQSADAFCPDCYVKNPHLSAPECECCGYPLPEALPGSHLCGECLTALPPYRLARAVYAYHDISRALVSRLKFHDQLHLAGRMGQWMYLRIQPSLQGVDAVLPVPLHRRRLWQRMSNQSLLLARPIAEAAKLPLLTHSLRRIKPTRRQTGLKRSQRLKNLHTAFAVPDERRGDIEGKILLLVDDVMTTGATLEACSRALLKAGAKEVRIVTFARTLLQKG